MSECQSNPLLDLIPGEGLPVSDTLFESSCRDQQVTVQELRDIAAKRNLTIPAKDEGDFLTLLRAADIAIKHVDAMPPYVDPRLVPQDTPNPADLATTRPFTKVAPGENPLNAWSHKASTVSHWSGKCQYHDTRS